MTENSSTKSVRSERQRLVRDRALAGVAGPRSARQWKTDALQEVFHMADRAPRLEILQADLYGDFEMIYRIDVPTPCWPDGDQLTIGNFAIFHLVYLDRWREEPPPGWGPLGIVAPQSLFHPNARAGLRGELALCLGSLPAGIPPAEIILLGYFLVSLQDLTLDERDPNGLLNPFASEYFRCRPNYVPLTRAGLFEDLNAEEQSYA
jgi:hypothetical protein